MKKMGKDEYRRVPKSDRRSLSEGHVKKGGVNKAPTTPKPSIKPPPQVRVREGLPLARLASVRRDIQASMRDAQAVAKSAYERIKEYANDNMDTMNPELQEMGPKEKRRALEDIAENEI